MPVCWPEWRVCSLATVGLLIPPLVISWTLNRGGKDGPNRDICCLAVGVATCVIVDIGVAGPILYSQERTGPFVRQIEALIEKAPGTVSFLQVGPDAEDVKFIANLRKPLQPQFVSSIETLWNTPGTHYVITTESAFRSLSVDESRSMHVLVRGRIGHKDFIAFTREEAG